MERDRILSPDELQRWLQARLPAHLFAAPPDIAVYDDEVVIVLRIVCDPPEDLPESEHAQFEQDLISLRREETRPLRMRLARDLQGEFNRPIGWGMRAGSSQELFTTRTVPVMTRLGRAERDVLDTLAAAGVADTRSAALAYAVRAFAAEHADWLDEVREAIAQVEQVRARLKLTRRAGPPMLVDQPEHTGE